MASDRRTDGGGKEGRISPSTEARRADLYRYEMGTPSPLFFASIESKEVGSDPPPWYWDLSG
ncbi:MAG: hypothetical protein NVS9B14_17170 [Candidatus Acidiferrum sp.]